jgi:hypothetical protein
MKKITIALLAVFFIGMANVNAQTEVETTTEEVTIEEVKKECPFTKNAEGKLVCVKTGKVCDASCENKKNGTCCKGEKKRKCSNSKKGDFDYGSTNNYSGEKSSCSKKAKKGCNKGAKKKGCCSKKGGEKKGCSKKTETKE